MSAIAVIIPIFNRADLVTETIDSILNQSFQDFRLYLVDDGSTDNLEETLSAYREDHRVTVIRQENLGQASAINNGIRSSQEEFIALCDSDDLWHKDRLSHFAEEIKREPDLALVCSDFYRGQDPKTEWESAWTKYDYTPTDGDAHQQLFKQNFVHRSAVLFSREHIEALGLFSEAIGGKCGADDRDMWLKLSQIGSVKCIHKVLVFSRQWEQQGSSSISMIESQLRLWDHWMEKTKNEKQLYRLAAHNSVVLKQTLAWRLRQQKDYALASDWYWQALKINDRRLTSLVGLAKVYICRVLNR